MVLGGRCAKIAGWVGDVRALNGWWMRVGIWRWLVIGEMIYNTEFVANVRICKKISATVPVWQDVQS